MKYKSWLIGWFVTVSIGLVGISFSAYHVDPFFHYHKPYLSRYYYELNNQRSQNDGIIKHFNYDAVITGTSMASPFKTSEANHLFDRDFIKVTFSGAYYKELNDSIETALKVNPNIKTVIRSLDLAYCDKISDEGRADLGDYPTYLYDNNVLNDVYYLLNRDIIFGRVYPMIIGHLHGSDTGITDFDDYPGYMESLPSGINTVKPDGITVSEPTEYLHLSEQDKNIISSNLYQNVIRVADEYPNVEFYYYFPPYSIAFWGDSHNDGTIYRWLEAERFIVEDLITHPNIHLFSFFSRGDILTDLNNYKDTMHCSQWVYSLMLKWMRDGKYQLTKDNFREVLRREHEYLSGFDYSMINGQLDYEADFYAAALLNRELTGAEPIDLTDEIRSQNELVVDLKDHNYLEFLARKHSDEGDATVCVRDKNGEVVGNQELAYTDSHDVMCQYVMDLSRVTGEVYITVEGADADFYIENMILY